MDDILVLKIFKPLKDLSDKRIIFLFFQTLFKLKGRLVYRIKTLRILLDLYWLGAWNGIYRFCQFIIMCIVMIMSWGNCIYGRILSWRIFSVILVMIDCKCLEKVVIFSLQKKAFFRLLLLLDEVANTSEIISTQFHDYVGILCTTQYFKALYEVFVFYLHQNIDFLLK